MSQKTGEVVEDDLAGQQEGELMTADR